MRQALYILGTLSDADIDWLASAGRRKVVAAGTSLVTQGKPIDALYLTLEGRFAVTIADSHDPNRQKTVRELAAGEIVGEVSLLDSRPPSASVMAVIESSVLEISRRDLDRQLTNNAPFAARFYRALAVFLAQRLRTNVILSGAGATPSQADADEADELDPAVLEQVSLAAARFQWIVQRLSRT